MKKFIAIMIGLLFTVALMAQTTGTTYTLKPNVTSVTAFSYTHTGDWDATSLKDSIGGVASLYWTFDIAKSNLYYYQFVIEYDTVLTVARAIGNHVTVALQASLDGTYFFQIDSVLFHPTTMWLPAAQVLDPTLGITSVKDVSTGVLWRYLRIKATGGDANKCSIISKLSLKVGIRY
ncbi:MAG TPA: hypothetical protein VMV77_04545 [Bacteroidales bacterium]|nr:hypothetical protein [Bacteroidales bacterium]